MTKSILSRLKDLTKQRRALFNQSCDGGSLCHGHLYWIELWETALLDHFNFLTSRDAPTTTAKGPYDASFRDTLKRLDEEAGRLDNSDEIHVTANAEPIACGTIRHAQSPGNQGLGSRLSSSVCM